MGYFLEIHLERREMGRIRQGETVATNAGTTAASGSPVGSSEAERPQNDSS